MNKYNFCNLSTTTQGGLIALLGLLILFNTLNVHWFNGILVLISLGLILYGLAQMGLLERVRRMINRERKSR